MKKITLFLFLLLTFGFKGYSFFDTHVGCYTVDASGNVTFTFVTDHNQYIENDGPGNITVIINGVSYGPLNPSSIHHDTNPVTNYRDFYDWVFTVPGTGLSPCDPNLPCITIQGYGNGYTICPCKTTALGGCLNNDTDPGNPGGYIVKLMFDPTVYTTFYGYMYLWTSCGAASAAVTPYNIVAEGTNYAYYYQIPAGCTDDHGCVTVYYTTSPPQSDDNTCISSLLVCKCCSAPPNFTVTESTSSSTGYTINCAGQIFSGWDFGDGTTATGLTVAHTYATTGSYLVCETSTNANGSECKKCQYVCLTDGNPTGISGGLGSSCDANFTVGVNGSTVSVFMFYSLSSGSFNYDFGDGTSASNSSGIISHTYSSPGLYTICVTVTTGGLYSEQCYRCITICIADQNPPPPARKVPSSHSSGASLAENIVIKPNPAKDIATLVFSLDKEANVKITIIDPIGRILSTQENIINAGDQNLEINVSNFPPGIYNVNIETGNGIVSKRLSVVR